MLIEALVLTVVLLLLVSPDEWIRTSETFGKNTKFKVLIKITIRPNSPPEEDKSCS
jgi:hypothetical protein